MTPSCPFCCTRLVKPDDLKPREHVRCPRCESILIWTHPKQAPHEYDRRNNSGRNFYQCAWVTESYVNEMRHPLRTMTRYRVAKHAFMSDQ